MGDVGTINSAWTLAMVFSQCLGSVREGEPDGPSEWINFGALRGVEAFDDVRRPASDFLGALQFRARTTLSAYGIMQCRIGDRDGFQQVRRPVPASGIGAVTGKTDLQSSGS